MVNTKKINILITAIGGGGHGDQILKALLRVDNERYRIFGADANSYCVQAKLVEEFDVLPLASDPSYLETLFSLINKKKIDVLFHGCEPELKLFAEYREEIESRDVFLPINPTELINLCMDKSKTNSKLLNLGFDAPRYMMISSESELNCIDWYPVVVKPATGGGGSVNVFIAQNQKELKALADYLDLGVGSTHFMVQEYVGTPDDEYTVGVLHSMEGDYINSIAMKRHLHGGMHIRVSANNKTGKKQLGSKLVISSGVSHGEIGRFDTVTRQCREIATKLGAKGPFNIQCRLVDNIIKVFEINPRFSGTTSIRAMVGFNEPDILIRKHLFGENIDVNFPYNENVVLRSLNETIL